MTIREKVTTRGGSVGYKQVRSKISMGKDGYGKSVTVAREKLMQKLGRDPGPNVVAAHSSFGSHFGGDKDQASKFATRGWNTAESNMNRADGLSATDKLKLRNYKSPVKPKKNLKDIIKKK